MNKNINPRYDAVRDETHYPAVDENACKNMAARQGWKLKRVGQNKDKILSADCVFCGNVCFEE